MPPLEAPKIRRCGRRGRQLAKKSYRTQSDDLADRRIGFAQAIDGHAVKRLGRSSGNGIGMSYRPPVNLEKSPRVVPGALFSSRIRCYRLTVMLA